MCIRDRLQADKSAAKTSGIESTHADKEQNKPAVEPITLQAIYVKDFSFEAPNSPSIFNESLNPEVDLQLNTKNRRIEENLYEVTLHLSVGCKQGKAYAFFVEIQQAGTFHIFGLNKNQIDQVMATFCADLLFPYARSTIDTILLQGGFPALRLAPINFMQVYQDSLRKKQAESNSVEK